MVNSNDIKRLDNYQLYLLIQNDMIDEHTRILLNKELKARNIAEDEMKRLENKYYLSHTKLNPAIEKSTRFWDPIFTAFALNYHFRQLASLKTQGKRQEAKTYMIRLYIGLLLYFTILIAFIFLQRSV